MIAALYVAKDGPYFGVEGVEPYDKSRDARSYAGPFPVIAHPPCERWGRYHSGGPNPAAERRIKGDDGGCFDRALWAVRNFGGVLEHPAYSAAWLYYGICQPDPIGGYLPAGDGYGAWVCQVHQGHYGHPADKATWLYIRAPRPFPELIWGPCIGKARLDDGYHSKEEREREREREMQKPSRITHKEAVHTPKPFLDLLVQICGQRSTA